MKFLKSILLGASAVLTMGAAAQAADLYQAPPAAPGLLVMASNT